MGAVGENGEIPRFDAFVTRDDGLEVCGELTLEQIAEAHAGEGDGGVDVDDDDEDDDAVPPPLVTATEAFECLQTVRRYLCQQDVVQDDVLGLIGRLETLMLVTPKQKQSTILDFFQKL